MRCWVALDASSDLLARLRTSSATTAKPLPAVPARAASTAAFSARMLVWKAIFAIVPMISRTSSAEALISSIAVIILRIRSLQTPTWEPAASAFPREFCAILEFSLALWVISVIVAESSSTARACSVAPCASACALFETWSELADTCSDDCMICASASLRLELISRIDASTGARSPT